MVRHVPWRKLKRDADDNVYGCLPQAFQPRPGEQSLSVNWVEFFPDPATRVRDTVWAMRKARHVGAKSAFAMGKVGRIKETCLSHGTRVRTVHDRSPYNPPHAGIRRLPREDLRLLEALAEIAVSDMTRNADIPAEPEA